MAAAVAFDPRYDVVFAGGNPTAANITASGGEPLLDLQPTHWLVVVSGGDLPASPNGGNLKSVPWRVMEVAVFKVFAITQQCNAATLHGHTVILAVISSFFRMSVAGGLSFNTLSSCKVALAELVRVAGPLARANPAAWTLGMAQLQVLPPQAGAAVPAAERWLGELNFGMLSTMDGAPRGAAVLCAMSTSRMTSAGRRTDDFKDAMEEVAEVIEMARPNWSTKAQRPKAVAAASIIMQKVSGMPIHLITCCSGPRAYDLAVSLRFTAQEAFPGYFAMSWQAAYPSLAALVLPSAESATALAFAGRLLGDTPSPAALDSLEAKIKTLLPHLDTPSLRQAAALDRVSAMEPLLRSVRSGSLALSGGTTDGDTATASDPLTWSRIFAQPLTVAFLAALEPHDIVPLIAYRGARVMLSHASPLGILMVAGKVKPPQKMLKNMAACALLASATIAVQRTMLVDDANVLRTEWFSAIPETLCAKLFSGKWKVDTTSPTSIDLWAEIAAPILAKRKGAHYLEAHRHASAAAFFVSEYELRLGSPIIVAFFATIGVTGTAANSLASVLATFETLAGNVAAFPNKFAPGRQACQELLVQAGQRCFADAAAAWVLMLASPLEQASKPAEFAPATNGLHAILAQLRVKTDFVAQQIEIDNLTTVKPASAVSATASSLATAVLPHSGVASTLSGSSSALSAAHSTLSHGSLALMPSASQVGSPPGSQASFNLTGVVGDAADPQTLLAEWGSRTHELVPHGNGYFFGNVYSGPADAHHVLPANTCPASLCPNRRQQHKFCIFTPGSCTHPPPRGVPLSTYLDNPPAPVSVTGKGSGKGGGKGARGAGRGIVKQGGRGRGRGNGTQ